MTGIAVTVDRCLQIDQDTTQGMYLTFELAGEGYGLEIRHVTEIIGIQKVTNVPGMLDHVIGVLNLRGNVIPVIDVRLRFRLPSRDYDERTCIIVVNVNDNSVGLVVDKVSEVVDIPLEDIEAPPATCRSRNQYIQGMGKLDQNVKILLNIEALIEDEEGEQQLTEHEVAI
ncbi:MAG: chemotaxis protein CheW [Deltaproteobacteria bacterium]|jgi:purine-binding chemotaxis protein CheW|nr:chemotaxis protein CheW [Deltaproteobacteria bacterium]MCW8892443.1 chemotaxis protein CheW [Deltaproteobacteria bacterium]MCW9050072.1 chemotaxis protein CheW [Deltaproteobacteria bacterium]